MCKEKLLGDFSLSNKFIAGTFHLHRGRSFFWNLALEVGAINCAQVWHVIGLIGS